MWAVFHRDPERDYEGVIVKNDDLYAVCMTREEADKKVMDCLASEYSCGVLNPTAYLVELENNIKVPLRSLDIISKKNIVSK